MFVVGTVPVIKYMLKESCDQTGPGSGGLTLVSLMTTLFRLLSKASVRFMTESPSGIPPECVVDVYRGLIIDETPETIIAEIKEALDEAGKDDLDWSWELEAELDDNGKYVYRPPNYTSPDSELVKVMYRSVPLALGKEAELFDDYAGGNDGRFYRNIGVPSVAFGAIGGNHHAPNEYVDIDSLVALAKVYLTTALLMDE